MRPAKHRTHLPDWQDLQHGPALPKGESYRRLRAGMAVLARTRLTPRAWQVTMHLTQATLGWNTDRCQGTYTEIAEATGLDRSHAYHACVALIQAGILCCGPATGGYTVYRLLPPDQWHSPTGEVVAGGLGDHADGSTISGPTRNVATDGENVAGLGTVGENVAAPVGENVAGTGTMGENVAVPGNVNAADTGNVQVAENGTVSAAAPYTYMLTLREKKRATPAGPDAARRPLAPPALNNDGGINDNAPPGRPAAPGPGPARPVLSSRGRLPIEGAQQETTGPGGKEGVSGAAYFLVGQLNERQGLESPGRQERRHMALVADRLIAAAGGLLPARAFLLALCNEPRKRPLSMRAVYDTFVTRQSEEYASARPIDARATAGQAHDRRGVPAPGQPVAAGGGPAAPARASMRLPYGLSLKPNGELPSDEEFRAAAARYSRLEKQTG